MRRSSSLNPNPDTQIYVFFKNSVTKSATS